MKLRQILSENITFAMKDRRLSQEDLSDITGVSQTQISAIKRCAKSTGVDIIQELADGLKIPYYAFFMEVDRFKIVAQLSRAGINNYEFVVR